MMYFWIIVYVILSVAGLVLFKSGTETASTFSELCRNAKAIIGVLCYVVNFPLYLYLVSKYELGYMHLVLRGLPCILIFLFSVWLFHEKVTVFKVIGAVMICVGVVLMSVKK